MRKYVANFSKSNSSPLRDTAPEDTAIAGAIYPAMTARIAGPVVIVNCAPGYGPGWTLSLPSWISAWRTISLPTRISKLAEFLAAASGLKVERSAMTSDSGVTISSGCTSPSNWAPHQPRVRTISSSPRPYSVSVYTTVLRGVSSSFRSIIPASCKPVCRDIRRDPWQASFQVAETLVAAQQITNDQQGPPFTHDICCTREPAILPVRPLTTLVATQHQEEISCAN